ncbi:tetratricopeptide repeat protein [Endothiovibrio diazotrophicus]
MSSNQTQRELTIVEALSEALDHHQQGRYQEAEQLYLAILAHQPDHADANHNLGALALQIGNPAAGLPYLKAAAEAAPHHVRFRLDYGEGLLAAGRPDEALQTAERALPEGGDDVAATRALAERALIAVFQTAPPPQALDAAERFAGRWPDAPIGWTIRFACRQSRGEFEEALQAARQAVRLDPTTPDAHSNLGIALQSLGRLEEAEAAYRRALAIRPDFAEAHGNLGRTLRERGRMDEAEAAYRRALAIRPDYADACYNLGNLLRELARFDEAAVAYRQALAIQPDDAEIHYDLGNTLRKLDRPEEAVDAYRQALALKPDDADTCARLGHTLWTLRRLEEAEHAYRQALAIRPGDAETLHNLGITLGDLGRPNDAKAAYRQALAVRPDYAEAYNNLGSTLLELERMDEAEATCRQAVKIKPDFAEAYNNLSIVLWKTGRLEEAEESYRQALAIKPDYVDAYSNLGNTLRELGRLDAAESAYRQALAIQPDNAGTHSNLLFLLDGSNRSTPEARLAEALRYGTAVASRAAPHTTWRCPPDPERPLQVGLVSGDLRNHPVGYFVETVLAELSSKRLSLNAYLTQACNDMLAARLRPAFARWEDVRLLSDEALARRIHDDAIDILIDLSGHTAGNRLPMFAWKPAPVQLSWLGYTATTGVAEIDYYLTDPVRVPPGHERWYSETVWRLPETRVCFTPPQTRQPVGRLPALDSGFITFGCFQNIGKVTDEVLAVWSRILRRVPNARLRLQAKQLASSATRERLTERLGRHGIDPARVALQPPTDREAYLQAHAEVDLILDTFPYPGGTTTCEALWMGVPTLTWAGESETSRNGASQLSCAGLAEWVAESEEAYVDKAVAFAEDLEGLAALRAGLRAQVAASPLFDARRFADHFETALREMWRRWCQSVVPPE